MIIQTVGPKRYQRIFFRFMDEYAERNNLMGDHEITGDELATMVDSVCERIRTGYHLTDKDHEDRKNMMQIIMYKQEWKDIDAP